MKHAEIEAFTKQKTKEQRMHIDKMKETARQQKQDRLDKRADTVPVEKYLHDARHSRT